MIGAAIAVPVIAVTVLIRGLARQLFPNSPQVQALVQRYGLWATIPTAAIAFAFISLPLAIAFIAVVVVYAVLRNRMGLPFGFPSNSTGDRKKR